MRQGAFLAVALLIAGRVAERLRPVELLDRGIASTPFLWAIVAWMVVLVLNTVAFDNSQMRELERTPLIAALVVGGLVFVTGVVGVDADFGRRLIYSLANALGAVLFWWGIFSIATLLKLRLENS